MDTRQETRDTTDEGSRPVRRRRRALLTVAVMAATLIPLSGGAGAALAGGGGCPGAVKEPLSGPAIGGVAPEGLAQADESRFCSGGATILTVQVKNVNLPDGTVLIVTLDFGAEGTITLSRHEGAMTSNLGHFAVSFDHVQVVKGGTLACASCGTVILSGGFFS